MRPSSIFCRSALCLSLFAAGAGCASTVEPGDSTPPDGAHVGSFVAHLSPRQGTLTFERVKATSAPGAAPQSIDDITIVQDDVADSGPANTVELVTNSTGSNASCPTGFQTNSFCGNVTARHFYSGRSLNNAYVQVTRIYDTNGLDLGGHSGINSDPAFQSLGNTLGLWKYTGTGVNAAGALGQFTGTNGGANGGARDWVFADPDGADTYIYLHVFATLTYSGYTMTGTTGATFIDACTATGAVTAMTNSAGLGMANAPLPFPFTHYGTLYPATTTNVTITRFGGLGFNQASTPNTQPYNTGTNVALPTTGTSAFKPGIYAFWDDINYTTNDATSRVCYATSGTAPNRKFVVTWKKMKFTGDTNGTTTLTFSTSLYETSDQIEFVYQTMTSGNAARANGNSATIGVQNETGSSAQATFNATNSAGTGKGYLLTPTP